jgi:hypothetical protein
LLFRPSTTSLPFLHFALIIKLAQSYIPCTLASTLMDTLAAKLIYKILKYQDTPTLRSLNLVNKSIHEHSKVFLYHTVSIEVLTTPERLIQATNRLRKVSPFVRHLIIEGKSPCPETEPNLYLNPLYNKRGLEDFFNPISHRQFSPH